MSDEFKNQTFETDLGQKAHVDRAEGQEQIDADWRRANAMVRAIGQGQNPKPDALKYHGSFVVHCYTPHTVGGMQFATQVLTRDDEGNVCPEWLADKGIAALRKETMAAYGRKRPVKRSGW